MPEVDETDRLHLQWDDHPIGDRDEDKSCGKFPKHFKTIFIYPQFLKRTMSSDCGVAAIEELSYPWNALIHITLPNPDNYSQTSKGSTSHSHFCSGSVINDLFILTSASCIYNAMNPPSLNDLWWNDKLEARKENVKVWLEISNEHSKQDLDDLQTYEVADIHYHYLFPVGRIRAK